MKPLLPQHKRLAALAGVLLAATAAYYFFVLRPKQQQVARSSSRADRTAADLKEEGWPLDADRLSKLYEQKEKELEKVSERARRVFEESTSTFDPKIQMFFGTNENFRNEVSRLDYQEEFNQIEQQLRGQGIIFAEEVLNLGENTSSDYTYQLVLKLWTVEEVTELVLNHDLTPAKSSSVRVLTETGKQPYASLISALPMVAYFVNEQAEEPYVLEFPVRMTVRGKLQDFTRFLASLTSEGRFVPISRMELRKVLPNRRQPALDVVEVEIECSCFYKLTESVQKQPTGGDRKVLPPGA